MRQQVGPFECRTEWTPAYDRRSQIPGKNYGVHGMDLRFILIGPRGATQLVIYTNWHLPHVSSEFEAQSNTTMLLPMPADLGYHAHEAQYEGQLVASDDCDYIGGPCFYDGSRLNADAVFERFVAEGEAVVWEMLTEEYRERFGTEKEGEETHGTDTADRRA